MVAVFLEGSPEPFGAATVGHHEEVQVFPGKKGAVNKLKKERSRDRAGSMTARVEPLH